MSRVPILALATVLLVAGCLGPLGGDGDGRKKIVLAIQPTDNPSKIQDKAAELERFLEERTGFDIEVLTPLSNNGVIEALRFQHADMAMLSAWPSYLANKIAGAEIVLAENREVQVGPAKQVQPYYFSYYVVPTGSGIQSLSDLQGKRVAFPSSTSTSGYVFPIAKLVNEGLLSKPAGAEADPKSFFGTVVFSGGYAQNWEALKRNQVDATVIAGDVNAKLYYEVLNGTRIVGTQGPIPSHGVVAAKHLPTEERAKLVAAFLELKGEHKELMRSLVSAIFVEYVETTTANHTAALQAALETTGMKFQERLG